jgi:hypothetical protein
MKLTTTVLLLFCSLAFVSVSAAPILERRVPKGNKGRDKCKDFEGIERDSCEACKDAGKKDKDDCFVDALAAAKAVQDEADNAAAKAAKEIADAQIEADNHAAKAAQDFASDPQEESVVFTGEELSADVQTEADKAKVAAVGFEDTSEEVIADVETGDATYTQVVANVADVETEDATDTQVAAVVVEEAAECNTKKCRFCEDWTGDLKKQCYEHYDVELDFYNYMSLNSGPCHRCYAWPNLYDYMTPFVPISGPEQMSSFAVLH